MEEKNVSVSELRNHLSRYLKRVERGDVILITKRGKPIGHIVPANLPPNTGQQVGQVAPHPYHSYGQRKDVQSNQDNPSTAIDLFICGFIGN